MWNRIEEKVLRGERLTADEGVFLLTDAPLIELGSLANELRARRTDPHRQLRHHPNPLHELCTVDCHFCASTGRSASRRGRSTHDVKA